MDELIASQSSKINFVPCVKWVKKGAAKRHPEKVQLTKQELKKIILKTESQLKKDDSDEEGGNPSSSSQNNQDEYNFEKYDNEGDPQHLAINSLAMFSTEEEDGNSDSDSEKEDDLIKSDDNLILVGHVEGDASVLEVYIYNEEESSLYVHHDLLLPSYPLCIEWLDYEPGQPGKGNLCAIGSMSPVIEIWDLDLVNSLEAAYTLGCQGSRRKKVKHVGHFDAVLDLAWNRNFHHILASGSVDKTILLWDLDQAVPHTTLRAFQDKVQCLKWHENEAQSLLAASCDKTAKLFDCRSDSDFKSWDLDGEGERIIWDPHDCFYFLVGTSTGSVQYFDSRQGMLWSFPAHEQEITGLISSPQCKGLLATTSSDGTMKTWDYQNTAQAPILVHTKEMKMKTIHCLELCPDLPFVVASGGENKSNNFTVLDLRSIDPVKHTFESRAPVINNADNEVPDDVEMESLDINN